MTITESEHHLHEFRLFCGRSNRDQGLKIKQRRRRRHHQRRRCRHRRHCRPIVIIDDHRSNSFF